MSTRVSASLGIRAYFGADDRAAVRLHVFAVRAVPCTVFLCLCISSRSPSPSYLFWSDASLFNRRAPAELT